MKKGHKRRNPFELAAEFLVLKAEKNLKIRLPGSAMVETNLRLLAGKGELAQKKRLYYIEKTGLMLKLLVLGILLFFLLFAAEISRRPDLEEHGLERRETPYEQELLVRAGGEEQGTIAVQVEAAEMTEKEAGKCLEELVSQMETYILGENTSMEEVRSDLQLIREIDGLPAVIEWELDSYEVLNLDGSIRSEHVTEEGTITRLTAVLTLGDAKAVYQGYARVLPPLLTDEELFSRDLQEALAEKQKESRYDAQLSLPERVNGKALVWTEKREHTAELLGGLCIICGILLFFARDEELKRQVKARELQMKQDYGEIVSKLVLLMNAGMTMRHAWEHIVCGYRKKRSQGLRFAYEEMSQTYYEMQSGVAEAKAYESFGERCRIPCYMKFSALLCQNLKKGTKGLSSLLELEVLEAFEQRKSLAKSQGEEAATRLLLPMFLLLIIVMVIVLVPAAMSIQI